MSSLSASVHIVDDDDAVRDSLRSLLESYGFTVRDYTSADAFLADGGLSKSGCLVLDLHMPGTPGLELLLKLRENQSRLPVIAMTGRSDPILKKQVSQAGAFILLEKPMQDEVLLWSIQNAIASQP